MRIGTFSSTFGGMIYLPGYSESSSNSDTGMHLWTKALHLLNNMMMKGWSLFLWGPGQRMGKRGGGEVVTHALGQRGDADFA